MPGSILGTRVLRTEDPALLTGSARYLNDLDLPGKLHAVFARSEVGPRPPRRGAHRRRRRRARGRRRAHRRRPRRRAAPRLRQGPRRLRPPAAGRPTSSASSARPIAVVVGETVTAAADGAAAVWADYEPLDRDHRSRGGVRRRRAGDLPRPRQQPGARGHRRPTLDLERDQRRRRARPLRQPARRRRADGDQRLRRRPRRRRSAARSTRRRRCRTGCTAQLAGALGDGRATTSTSSAPQVGGGFGGKAGICPEYSAVGGGRPAPRPPGVVVAGPQRRPRVAPPQPGPDPVRRARLPTRDGTFTGLRVHLVGDAGAYPGIGAFLPAGTKRMSNGTYRFPAIQFDVAVAVTNTTPTGAYRGAGRPEATALLERLVDHAAHELGHRPDRAAPPQPPRRRRVPVHHAHRRHLRHRRATARPLDAAAEAIGYDDLRKRAGRSGGPTAIAHRARHRRRRLRRDHRRRRGQGVRRRRGPRRRLGRRSAPGRSPTARATRRRSP